MFDEKQFKETFNQVHASEGFLTEVLEMTTKTEHKIHHHHKAVRTVLIAAVLICALTLTAAAADAIAKKFSGETTSVIEAFFGENGEYVSGGNIVEYDEWGKLAINLPAWSREPVDMEAAERLVAPYLFTLEENTVTKGGFTYTIHAVLYDSNTEAYMIRWSVENPDGLGDYGIGMNGEFFTKEGSDMYAVCGGRDYLDTANSTDTKLYLSSFGVDWMDEVWCEFGRWYDWEKGKMEAWCDTQKIVIPRADRGGMKALTTGDDITVSPVAIRFEGKEYADAIDELVIRFKDGGEYVVCSEERFVDNTTYGLIGSEGYVTYTFNRIVDVDNVSGILFNGEILPVA
ncbi:MAG: hypothetical protein IJD81_05605 [Oscillospiraceae bacterium]|nr:hypothetical protein [Oscillospiraceae bacterium]